MQTIAQAASKLSVVRNTSAKPNNVQRLHDHNEMLIEAERKCDHLWDLMNALYSEHWVNKHGDIPSQIWINAVASVTPEQFSYTVKSIEQRIMGGNAWCPTFAEVMALASGGAQFDYAGGLNRLLSKQKPTCRVELYVYEKYAFNLRASAHDKATRDYKRYIEQALELDKRGELHTNAEILARALPSPAVPNKFDAIREQYDNDITAFNPLQARINALRNKRNEWQQ